MYRREIRFALTGIFVTGVHTIIAIVFIKYFFLSPPLSNGAAFIGATIISYVINTAWSFSSQIHGRTLFRFLLVSIVGILLSVLVALIAQKLGFSYLAGIIAVALTIPPITFLSHNYWTYR